MHPVSRLSLSLSLPGGSIISLRGPRGLKNVCTSYTAGHTGHHDIVFMVPAGGRERSLLLVIETPSADPNALSKMDQSLIRIEMRQLETVGGDKGGRIRRGA
jgi:hypothetical protein